MDDTGDDGALEMVRSMLRWTARDQLDWEVSPATLTLDRCGDVAWSIRPKVGGPVVITHKVYSLHHADLSELADVATALLDCGQDVERHSHERAEYEQDMRKAARSLLRRKAAEGIQLVSVVSQPIPTDYYQDIGLVVTLAWETADCQTASATYEVGNVDDLREELDVLLGWDDNGLSRLAA